MTASVTVKIAVAQINPVVGDLAGNVRLILASAETAKQLGADLLLTPELVLTGYPPEDLLLRDGFYRATERALAELAGKLAGMPAVIGHPHAQDGRRYNAASLLRGGRVAATYFKHHLPNTEVFDEERYFSAGDKACVFELKGTRFGLNICEDVWLPGPATAARAAGAEVLLVPNGSPYHLNKQSTRYDVVRARIAETGLPVVFCNIVGGQDELVFDGASFVMDAAGTVTRQFGRFEETTAVVEFIGIKPVPGAVVAAQSIEAEVYQALCLGVRDYLGKNGFPGAILGLSGGVDSALTLAIACDALGAGKVRALMMPSQYTADISWLDSREMVQRLGVRYDEIPIRPVYDAFMASLADEFRGREADTAEENLQARIRGTLLMALSNKYGSIVLTTGNKSEMAVGYSTLYGDMAGGFAVIKDIAKTLVYRLARYRNSVSDVIPERILTRAPSAELRPDQTDQDSLPAYEVLDAIMEAFTEHNLSSAEIVARGFSQADVSKVVRLIRASEYKRRQSPVGIRITPRAFGRDWRYPITSRFAD
jgi:NAD+ synthase (glutamine-hydrolysing)